MPKFQTLVSLVVGLSVFLPLEFRAHALPPLPSPVPCPSCWVPPQIVSWQWQFSGKLDVSVNAAIYDIDLFDNEADVVDTLHASGRKAVCYISAGSWENWRPDAAQFPASLLGKPLSGWPGERWLDIRQLAVLAPLMQARLELCLSKGFDGVEFDNVDAYTNTSGFPLTADHQLAYNVWLANEAHVRGLSVALKNDGDQVQQLLPYFDWALVEECFRYNECGLYSPFVQAGKAVMAVEYGGAFKKFCSTLNTLNFNGMQKRRNLNAWRKPCR